MAAGTTHGARHHATISTAQHNPLAKHIEQQAEDLAIGHGCAARGTTRGSRGRLGLR